ncbi:hypothetical protein HU200_061495 [Digitaria exilis]|uniref:F-box domain-containing protein n=1 Tax=Digitaria exilis TaxID=1010633 RepID=A0A835AAD8_9POAL|nr:hypothetical protein HU200_061495 [Digitaria exilis]
MFVLCHEKKQGKLPRYPAINQAIKPKPRFSLSPLCVSLLRSVLRPTAPPTGVQPQPGNHTMPPQLPDDVVEEILARFPPDEPALLVRAALACKAWHRIVSGAGFRRRLHGRAPPLLGFFHHNGSHPPSFNPTSPPFRPPLLPSRGLAHPQRPPWLLPGGPQDDDDLDLSFCNTIHGGGGTHRRYIERGWGPQLGSPKGLAPRRREVPPRPSPPFLAKAGGVLKVVEIYYVELPQTITNEPEMASSEPSNTSTRHGILLALILFHS